MYADIQLMNRVFAADIDASAKIVLFAIIYHANKETHEAFPSWNTLMNETSLSRSTIVRAIKQLVDAGIISKHRRWNGGLIYRLERSPPVHKWCHTDTRGVTETPGGITETPEGCHTDTGVVSHRLSSHGLKLTLRSWVVLFDGRTGLPPLLRCAARGGGRPRRGAAKRQARDPCGTA